jgi:hypothetical protein
MNNTVLLVEGAQGICMFTAYSNVRFNYTELYGYNEPIASYRMTRSLADSIVNERRYFGSKHPLSTFFVSVVL